MLRFNTRSKRFRAGSVTGKSLILRWEEISGSSDPRLLLISRFKVRFLPRSPKFPINMRLRATSASEPFFVETYWLHSGYVGRELIIQPSRSQLSCGECERSHSSRHSQRWDFRSSTLAERIGWSEDTVQQWKQAAEVAVLSGQDWKKRNRGLEFWAGERVLADSVAPRPAVMACGAGLFLPI